MFMNFVFGKQTKVFINRFAAGTISRSLFTFTFQDIVGLGQYGPEGVSQITYSHN